MEQSIDNESKKGMKPKKGSSRQLKVHQENEKNLALNAQSVKVRTSFEVGETNPTN